MAHLQTITKVLGDEKSTLKCNLVELRSNSEYTIKTLSNERDNLKDNNDILMFENAELQKRLDISFEERLCIPRLEEKLNREMKSQLHERDVIMRQKEMYWSQ